jgi:hypothetical protein
MSDFLIMLFVVLAIVVAIVVVWFILAQPKGNNPVRVDFDLYKGKEENDRLVRKGR